MLNLPLTHDFTGKVVVVTGAGGVLCGDMARAYAQAGAKVAALDLNEAAVLKLAEEVTAEGFIMKGYKANVLELEALEAVHQQILADFGPCDILINGAGGNHPKGTTPAEQMTKDTKLEDTFFGLTPEGFEFVNKLNLVGTILPCQVFCKEMLKKGGSVLNFCSMAAYQPLTKVAAYGAAKAGIMNFTSFLATHLAPMGIRVNAIAPGFFSTIQNAKLLYNEDGSLTERSNKIITHTPMRRFGVPEDLTGALVFLCDEQYSGFVTGVVLPVDGGFSAYSGV